MLHIGCHLSVSKGFYHMGKQALSIGADTFQFFTRNPRGASAKKLDLDDAAKLNELMAQNNFAPIVAHAPYTLNACSADENIRNLAKTMMAEDIKNLDNVSNVLYNFHPGSHVGQGVDIGIEFICQMLNEIMYEEQKSIILLETMAGKGSEVGSAFEELRRIIDGVNLSDKLGVCLDTCHVNDAGYDIVNNLDGVLEEFDRVIGIERLKAIHINDSINPLGAHKDRHAKIGEGHIGTDAFERIINHPYLRNLPFNLETPNDLDGYADEIKLLRGLYHE
ncbi:MAG: deoxyribonuclease IV [Ruminococcaceae bacterium]|nr:deoxyribonuclease IV [Oscillospiraceae bacterium]